MNELIKRLFEAMRCDLGVMAEHNDSENALLQELQTSDFDILAVYAETFL